MASGVLLHLITESTDRGPESLPSECDIKVPLDIEATPGAGHRVRRGDDGRVADLVTRATGGSHKRSTIDLIDSTFLVYHM